MQYAIFAAWLFIWAVTAIDTLFAWQFRSDMEDWETNPLVRWVVTKWGVWPAILFRICGVVLAMGVATMAPIVTLLVLIPSLALAGIYAYGWYTS